MRARCAAVSAMQQRFRGFQSSARCLSETPRARIFPISHLQQYIRRADEKLAAQIEDADAPFWRHVREAALAYRGERA